MTVKKFTAAALVICAALSLFDIVCRADDTPQISAECAVVADGSGELLFEKEPDKRMLIASTTKIMTALVTLENCDIYEAVEIAPESVGVEGSSIYLKNGEKVTVLELLYGVLLESGNDAAAALAYHVAGGIAEFAEMMNERAGSLGLDNTHFTNPHGLDDEGHYSSAADLAIIMAEAIKNDAFRRITSTKSVSIGGRTFSNHNKLLSSYSGVFGGKTGYTKSAGRILVTCCERDGLCLICVTINAPDDWTDHATLYDWAFGRFKSERVTDAGTVFYKMPVISGTEEYVEVTAERELTLTVLSGDEVKTRVILPKFVYAPVERGSLAGRVDVYVNGKYRESVKLFYSAGRRSVSDGKNTFTENNTAVVSL